MDKVKYLILIDGFPYAAGNATYIKDYILTMLERGLPGLQPGGSLNYKIVLLEDYKESVENDSI